jgi:hypothetical protein
VDAHTILRPCAAPTIVPATDLLDRTPPPRHAGDKGYVGMPMFTPKRRPAIPPLHPDNRNYNKTVNQVHYKIEQVVANIKTCASCTPATEDR